MPFDFLIIWSYSCSESEEDPLSDYSSLSLEKLLSSMKYLYFVSFENNPSRGPVRKVPTNPAIPPVKWTKPAPAKSLKPKLASHPSCQVIAMPIGNTSALVRKEKKKYVSRLVLSAIGPVAICAIVTHKLQ